MLSALLLLEGPYPRHADVPAEIITGTGVNPRPRLRVDVSDTAFMEGRQFRVFYEFNIASGTALFGRFVVPSDVIIHHRELSVVQGNLRFALSTGGTASGTWTSRTVIPVNSMASRPLPVYQSTVTAAFGGTVSAGAEVDLALLETSNGNAPTVTNLAPEVGLGAGTYYIELRNTGGSTVRGLYQVIWEEVQPRSSAI